MKRVRAAFISVLLLVITGAAALQLAGAAGLATDIVMMMRGDFGNRAPPQTEARARLVKALPIRTAEGKVDTLDLSGPPSVLLAFSESCSVCKQNMSRWLELILDLRRQGSRVYAVGRGTAADSTFWGALAAEAELISVTDTVMLGLFATNGVPATTIISEGRVAAVFLGQIGPWRRDRIVERVRQ